MLECQIVGLTQDMNFDDNVAQTFVVLQLPDGTRIRAAVDDDTATKVVTLQVTTFGAPKTMTRAPAASAATLPALASPPSEDEGEPDAVVFGGDVEEADEEKEPMPEVDPDEFDVDNIQAAPPEVAAAHEAIMQEAHLTADGKPIRQRRGKGPHDKKKQRTQAVQAGSKPGGRKNLFRATDGTLIAPAKTVPRNQAGYPMATGNGVDPETLTSPGAGGIDEDGVGQV